jgi:hypothetical protein
MLKRQVGSQHFASFQRFVISTIISKRSPSFAIPLSTNATLGEILHDVYGKVNLTLM